MTVMRAADQRPPPALEVRGLTVDLSRGRQAVRAVDDVSFTVNAGEIVAVVGESGSGKSVLLQSLLGVVRGAPGVVSGQVILRFRDGTVSAPFADIERAVRWRGGGASVSPRWRATVERRFRPLRGRRIGLVLQNGRAALDPFYTVGHQLAAVVEGDRPRAEAAEDWLERLGFDDPRRVMSLYPHELSGGMAQRVMLGVVLAREPELLLLDELTTGLDVSLQASVLELLARWHREVGFGAVLVTHDFGIARRMSSKVVIMREGRVEQQDGTERVFERQVPLTAYTERLVQYGHDAAVAQLSPASSRAEPGRDTAGRPPRLVADGVGKTFGGAGWWASPPVRALTDIGLTVEAGACVALVGESGCGKTTLTRILAGLTRPDEGEVTWGREVLGGLGSAAAARLRRRRKIMFQNPYTSLNPAMTARGVVAESLVTDLGMSPRAAREDAVRRLGVLGLDRRADQPLGHLSGGERRRVGLLTALQAPGELVVLDEPTAGLDAEHRAGVQRLILAARDEQPDRTVLLVSHDMGFVVGTADRIVVLYGGHVVEETACDDFLDAERPHHPYTQLLWDASRYVAGAASTPGSEPAAGHDADEGTRFSPGGVGRPGPIISATEDVGCVFRSRCAVYRSDSVRWSICERQTPGLMNGPTRRRIACHGVRDAESNA